MAGAGLVAVAALLLSACSTPLSKSGITQSQATIKDEFVHAAAERKSQAEQAEKALMPPLQVEMPKTKGDAELRFDLSVVGAPANQVFMALVTGTHYSMLMPPDLSGTITLNLKDVTIKEALDTIRELYGYEYKVQGSRIFIQPNTLQSRVFQINYLAARRMGNSDLRVMSSSVIASSAGSTSGASSGSSSSASSASSSTPTTAVSPSSLGNTTRSTDTSRVSTSSDADFWRDLTTSLNSIVGSADGRSVIINPLSGVAIVRALPGDLRNVENYLKATQLMVERQVMIEAKIISVTLNNDYQAGINWSIFNSVSNGKSMMGVMSPNTSLTTSGQMQLGTLATGLTVTPGKFGSATTAANGLVGLAFQTANFAALLSFLETQGDVAVLSSPRIATLNNQKAVLKVGTDDMFVVNVTGGTASTSTVAGTPPTVTLQSYFSGISLDVTPQIDEEGNVTLHVHPAISTVTEVQKVIDMGVNGGVMKLPLPSSNINETDSIVRVQDGNVVAIGGLMRQTQSSNRAQLPGAGNGILSNILGQRSTGLYKTEMVILIKPTILANDKDWQSDLQNIEARFDGLSQKPAAKK